MSARAKKSLVHNLQEGIDIPRHREHRSKKGRRYMRPTVNKLIAKSRISKFEDKEWKRTKLNLVN